MTPLVTRPAARLLAQRLYVPPRSTRWGLPSEHGMDFDEDTVITADGVALHVWVIPPPTRLLRGIAVVGHGIGQRKVASLPQARMVHEAGYGVVMYDHRNHGQSGLTSVTRGMAERFAMDVTAVASFAQATFDPRLPVLAYGFAFSAFATVSALREDTAINAVICEAGPVIDLDALLVRFAECGRLGVPAWVTASRWGQRTIRECAAGVTDLLDVQWPPPLAEGHLLTTRMLLLMGRDDPIVSAEEGERFAALYPFAQCIMLPGGHLDTVRTAPEHYRKAVIDFLTEGGIVTR